MPSGLPDLSGYLNELGDPSASVLAETRSELERVIAAGERAAARSGILSPAGDSSTPRGQSLSSARWKRTTVLAALAAASIAAIVVPLSVRSGNSAHLQGSALRSHVGPLADTGATPKGWSPIAFETVQVSVPSSWFIEGAGGYGCSSGVNSMLFVGEMPHLESNMGCRSPTNTVSVKTAATSPVPHARAEVENGVHVEIGWRRVGTTVTHLERGLGMDVTASGPVARNVLRTITHSPLSVVLGSAVNGTPVRWRTVDFGGLQFAVPGSWQVTRDSMWGGCPFDIEANVLRLSTAQSLSAPRCFAPSSNAGYEAAVAGMVVGAGPQVTGTDVTSDRCVQRDDLRICIEPAPLTGGLTAGRQLGLLTAEVFLAGQNRPDQVEIGLAGSGLTPLRIFDSLRPSSG